MYWQMKKVDRRKVNWQKARCLGIPTDVFFPERDVIQFRQDKPLIRRICFSCPIWEQCLEVAFAAEDFGIWGGLTEKERNAVLAKRPSEVLSELEVDLKGYGLTLDQIKKIAEVERIVQTSN